MMYDAAESVAQKISDGLKWPKASVESWLRVEWEQQPEEWMLRAAIAFDTALHTCAAPDNTDLKDTTVIHICVFKESERQQNCKGTSLPPPGVGEHEILANPMVERVTEKPVLWTAFGQWLDSRGLLNFALAGAVFLLVALHIVGPGDKLTVADTVAYNTKSVTVVKPHAYVLVLHIILYTTGLYFAYHRISKDMLKLASGFEAAVIMSSCAVVEAVKLHELIYNYGVGNKYLPIIDIVLYAGRSIVRIASHYTVAISDAFTGTICGKMGVLIPFIISLTFDYFKERFLGEWSKRERCELTECTTAQGLYLGFLKNEIIFALKLLVPYLRGRSYAVLNFRAIDPARELYIRQRSRNGLFFSSILWRPSHRTLRSNHGVSSRCSMEDCSSSSSFPKHKEEPTADLHTDDVLQDDAWVVDERAWDDEVLHQVPIPSADDLAALGEDYFGHFDADQQFPAQM